MWNDANPYNPYYDLHTERDVWKRAKETVKRIEHFHDFFFYLSFLIREMQHKYSVCMFVAGLIAAGLAPTTNNNNKIASLPLRMLDHNQLF